VFLVRVAHQNRILSRILDAGMSSAAMYQQFVIGLLVALCRLQNLATGFLLYSSRHLTADVSVSSLGFSVFCSLIHNKVPFRFHIPFVHDFFVIAQQPPVDQGLLIIEALRSHSDTPHSVGLPSTSDQPDVETYTWQHTTLTPCLRWESNPQSHQPRDRIHTP